MVRFHLSLNVVDLEHLVPFYQHLLGVCPTKRRPDYAKFETECLVLSLEPGSGTDHSVPDTHLNHLGFRVPDSETLVDHQRRLEEVGIATLREEGVACCYARQTKFWVTDPDGLLWELYVLEEDLGERGEGTLPVHLPTEVSASARCCDG
jgi:catechol-2,3-dioxygenase